MLKSIFLPHIQGQNWKGTDMVSKCLSWKVFTSVIQVRKRNKWQEKEGVKKKEWKQEESSFKQLKVEIK